MWVRAVLAVIVAAAPCAAPCVSWRDGRGDGLELFDLSREPASATLAADGIGQFDLEPALDFRGALYDTLLVGPELGTALLTWRGDDATLPADAEGLLIEPLRGHWISGRGHIQLRRSQDAVAVRWVGLSTPAGDFATFEAVVEPAGVRYQYFRVPLALRGPEAGVRLEDRARPDAASLPASEGFDVGSGAVVTFPGDLPWRGDRLLTGCGIATPWCDVINMRDPGCLAPHDDETPCLSTVERRWHFNEGAYCRSCPYTFYVTVECGTEMHLPFLDMEGNQIRITDVFTGTELELEAVNDCARGAFQYCNYCATGGNRIVPDRTGASCAATPKIDCLPYFQRSTLIQWGYPPQDLDGDGVAEELPCGPANGNGCTGLRTGAWPQHEEQNTDVVLRGSPALCGVFRLDVLSGGFHWFLSANCTGIVPTDPAEIARNFQIFQNCGDALAAFDPVPELSLTRLDFTGDCPDVVLEIEVSNLGCVDAQTSPVRVDFERNNQGDLDIDLGAVAAGTSVVARIPVSLVTTPQNVTATVDPMNLVSECTEQAAGSFSGCEPTTGAETLTVRLCECLNAVSASVGSPRLASCGGSAVRLDATSSRITPCVGGTPQYRLLQPDGTVARDWSPVALVDIAPLRCPSLEVWTLEARCSSETLPACTDALEFEIACTTAPSLAVSAEPTDICAGEATTLTATAGFAAYRWEDGATGRTRTVRPPVTTTYRLVAVSGSGCDVPAETTVTVRPDPVPGPVGATLRVRREDPDVTFSWRELGVPVGDYRLLLHEADGARSPCAAAEPPQKPWPAIIQVASVIDVVPPGAPPWTLRHRDGVTACPRLLFYKVVGTSPCTFTPGPACNGFPMQYPPCP